MTHTPPTLDHENWRRRLADHIAVMTSHQVVTDRYTQLRREVERLRRRRTRSRITCVLSFVGSVAALTTAGVIAYPLPTAQACMVLFAGLIAVCMGSTLATRSRVRASESDGELEVRAAFTTGHRELAPVEGDQITRLVGAYPQFAPFVERWIAQGGTRLSMREATLVHQAASLQSIVDDFDKRLAATTTNQLELSLGG